MFLSPSFIITFMMFLNIIVLMEKVKKYTTVGVSGKILVALIDIQKRRKFPSLSHTVRTLLEEFLETRDSLGK